MSAFTVTDEHIAVLVTAGLAATQLRPLRWEIPAPSDGSLPIESTTGNGVSAGFGFDPNSRTRTLTRASVDVVGQMLLDQNTASVNHRYNDDDLTIYTYTPPRAWRSPVEVLKAIKSYRYQAGETRNWTDTEAHAFCAALESAVIDQLPGYDDAAWAIGRDTPTLAEQRTDHPTQ